MVIRPFGRGARVSAELQRKVQKPVTQRYHEYYGMTVDNGSRVLLPQHRRLPVCTVAASSSPQQVLLSSIICSARVPLISAAFQKPSLDASTMDRHEVTLHIALAIATLPRLVVAPYLAFSLAQRRHWKSP